MCSPFLSTILTQPCIALGKSAEHKPVVGMAHSYKSSQPTEYKPCTSKSLTRDSSFANNAFLSCHTYCANHVVGMWPTHTRAPACGVHILFEWVVQRRRVSTTGLAPDATCTAMTVHHLHIVGAIISTGINRSIATDTAFELLH